jgi:hypothetical protein
VLTESLTVNDIKALRKEIFSEYKLQDYVYLKQMWDVSERWAFPCFDNLSIYTRMTTMQRSEPIYFVLKQVIMSASWMAGFVRKYELFFH